MKLQMNARDNIRSFFTTPLVHFILPNAAIINPGLSHFLLEMEKRAGASQHPPLEGWHSGQDLAESSHPDVAELMDSARSAVFGLLGIMTHVERFQAQPNLRAWASIYRPRTFSRTETHTGTSWSGMYFVRAAILESERSTVAGRVSFHDPRNRAAAVDLPGLSSRNTFEVKPRDGLMLVYPSWLQCHLNPFESDSATVLIAFTSRITGFQALE